MAKYKRIFADGYSYFITMTTHRRHPILIENIELLRESFRQSKRKFNYKIDAIVIMPDHLHMVITPDICREYPKIIGYIKAYFSRHCDERYYREQTQSYSRYAKRHKAVWQKRYYLKDFTDACIGWSPSKQFIEGSVPMINLKTI